MQLLIHRLTSSMSCMPSRSICSMLSEMEACTKCCSGQQSSSTNIVRGCQMSVRSTCEVLKGV